jgi:hypothetical protein
MLTNDATHSRTRAPRTPRGRRPVLRWMFERRNSALTAQIDVTPSGTYELSVVPHWDVSRAVIEPFGGPVDALHRHAEIARQLREVGWTRVY